MSKFLVFCLLIVAIFLATPNVDGQPANISFSTNVETYATSLDAFRAALTRGSQKVFNIPLLPPNVTDSNRFMEISLTNSNGVTVKLAIDVLYVYVMGYYTPNPRCSGSYFFNDTIAMLAMRYVFKNAGPQRTLKFDGSYGQLARAGGDRTSLILGLPTLSKLVPALYEYSCPNSKYKLSDVAQALVLAIQTISEAARFQKIQDAVPNMRKPTGEVLSLENNWSPLSKAVQQADPRTGQFNRNILLTDANNRPVNVTNVNSPYVEGNIQLLLNKQNAKTTLELRSVIHPSRHENYATM